MCHTVDRGRAYISIHALLAESDGCDIVSIERCSLFLSTLSLRRATHTNKTNGGTHHISIHALLAESDGSKDEHSNL